MTDLPATAKFLTVKELHQSLQQRGLDISYSTLADFLNAGDISTQLQINGGGNARRILPDVAQILENFWPIYREAGGRKPLAPTLLRRFLAAGSEVPGNAKLPPTSSGLLVPRTDQPGEIATVLTEKGGEAIDLLRRAVEALEQQRQPEDHWIGAEEAMALLHCSRRALGRRVKPVMPGTWSLVQIQAFMRRKREGGKP